MNLCDACTDRGMCCRYVELPLARHLTADERHWVNLHPNIWVADVNGSPVVHIQTICSALSPEGLCTLWGTELRPAMCGIWPDRPQEQAPDGCAYKVPELALVARPNGHIP